MTPKNSNFEGISMAHIIYRAVSIPLLQTIIPIVSISLDFFIFLLTLFLLLFLLGVIGFPVPPIFSTIFVTSLYIFGVYMTRHDASWFRVLYTQIYLDPASLNKEIRYVC